ncbi:MAG: DUF5709 domain-containing protein [Mobilicoccus sp.]|nr:DUF5709 domain-containing protein [Mobilicoccus sp.]
MSENGYAEQSGDDAVEQLQAADTLIDRGVDDVLDEGYIAPDQWSPAQGFGNTPAEMREGETLAMRVKQEEPEVAPPDDSPWNPDGESREVGTARSGRLVDSRSGGVGAGDGESIAFSVGIDGGAASAEEAAMHIIEPEDDDDVE